MNPLRAIGTSRSRRRRRASDGRAQRAGEPTDQLGQWMVAAGRGDQSVFGRLYDALAPMVHGIALQIVRDPAQSEEVTQEVFVEIWRLAPRYDAGRGTVKSWVATVAHRRAVDRVRSEQAGRRRDQRSVDQIDLTSPPADEAVEHGLDRQRVQRALAALTDVQRESVELAYYGGHTYREVAALLDVPEGTVKTRIRDGLIRLRDELGGASP